MQQQERDNRMQQMAAEAEARRVQVKADSEKAQAESLASAQRVRSDMEANTRRTQAQAEADSVRLKAQAEADAVKIHAEAFISQAKAERAKLLAATPLGEKLSLLEVYGDVVKQSNEGVQRIVYVDPTTTQAGNPFSLLTLQTLQKDLAELGGTAQKTAAFALDA